MKMLQLDIGKREINLSTRLEVEVGIVSIGPRANSLLRWKKSASFPVREATSGLKTGITYSIVRLLARPSAATYFFALRTDPLSHPRLHTIA